MKTKPKFLVLPNGTMIQKTAIVAVRSENRCVITNCPPRICVDFMVGNLNGYAQQNCQSERERDDLIVRIRKEFAQ